MTRALGDWLPLTHVLEMVKEPWLTGTWAGARPPSLLIGARGTSVAVYAHEACARL